jgi:hypothetical protein
MSRSAVLSHPPLTRPATARPGIAGLLLRIWRAACRRAERADRFVPHY